MASSSAQSAAQLTPAEIPTKIDLLISLHLHLWTALTITIQNGWGTSNPQIGKDKRDWLAGAVSDLFAQNQLRDVQDLEEVLEQVMFDEFEVVIDDDSLEEVAQKIWKGVAQVKKGDGSEVATLLAAWNEKQKKGNKTINVVRGHGEDDDDDDEDSSDEDENDEHLGNGTRQSTTRTTNTMDVDMDEAPALVDTTKKKAEPVVDEDGFTTVVSKKRG